MTNVTFFERKLTLFTSFSLSLIEEKNYGKNSYKIYIEGMTAGKRNLKLLSAFLRAEISACKIRRKYHYILNVADSHCGYICIMKVTLRSEEIRKQRIISISTSRRQTCQSFCLFEYKLEQFVSTGCQQSDTSKKLQ